MKIAIEQHIHNQRIVDVLITAFEGGSNYWYATEGFTKAFCKEGEDKPWYESMVDRLDDETFNLPVYDIESVGGFNLPKEEWDLLGVVTTVRISKALKDMANDYPEHYLAILTGNYDSVTGDVLFQLCTMDKIVFG